MSTLLPLDVNPKFKKLLRPLSQDEYQRLEWAVLKDGIQDSIKYWPKDGKNWIVDGHNRFNIWSEFPTELEAGYRADPMDFGSEDEALEWIIENQLRRRNLTTNERILYFGRLFEMRKKRRGGHHTAQEAGQTAEQIAQEQDVSPRTVTRSAEVVKAYDEADVETQKKFAEGTITQAELLRLLKKKEETKEKKDKFHNEKTKAIAAIGERITRTITALDNQGQDFLEVCKALKIDPAILAPALAHLAGKLKREMKQAESLKTVMWVGGLCPQKEDKDTVCGLCGDIKYVTAIGFEDLKEHYGIEDKAKAASD